MLWKRVRSTSVQVAAPRTLIGGRVPRRSVIAAMIEGDRRNGKRIVLAARAASDRWSVFRSRSTTKTTKRLVGGLVHRSRTLAATFIFNFGVARLSSWVYTRAIPQPFPFYISSSLSPSMRYPSRPPFSPCPP